jgi:hypothetical protein
MQWPQKASDGEVEAAPEEMHRARLAQEPGAEQAKHRVGLNERVRPRCNEVLADEASLASLAQRRHLGSGPLGTTRHRRARRRAWEDRPNERSPGDQTFGPGAKSRTSKETGPEDVPTTNTFNCWPDTNVGVPPLRRIDRRQVIESARAKSRTCEWLLENHLVAHARERSLCA